MIARRDLIQVGILGYGAIGSHVATAIVAGEAGKTAVSAILCRDLSKYPEPLPQLTNDPDTFFATSSDLVVEAAGQEALRTYGRRVLENGSDLLVTSIGAFTDDDFWLELVECAEKNGRRLLLASGALPAVDWMSAAALSGVKHVTITQTKPVASWRQTRATEFVDLDVLTEPTRFFHGTARQAASIFSKSSNITAMLALATAGLDATTVALFADPTSGQMRTQIEFESNVGSLRAEWHGIPSKNPSTSAGVPLSVVKALRNLTGTVAYGV
ncbi:MAG: aspartate dehydrogenase [Chloroflexota bacterium]